nr:hypothetical protein CJLB15_00087 [Campylobacter phage CJLB-15]
MEHFTDLGIRSDTKFVIVYHINKDFWYKYIVDPNVLIILYIKIQRFVI